MATGLCQQALDCDALNVHHSLSFIIFPRRAGFSETLGRARNGRRSSAPQSRRATLAVKSQEVVHSAQTEEAEVAETLAIQGRTEWTSTRMPG